jgi:tRNA(fMet)-specific endonuclease VapC
MRPAWVFEHAMLVLDSNTISCYFRGDPELVPRLQAVRPADLAVPAIVEYELRYGLMCLPEQAATPRLAALAQLLRPMHILHFDTECAAHAARLRATLEAAGTPIGPHDTLIAATVLRHQATLVTRNVKEFSRVPGLQWLNWHGDLASKGL